MKAPYGSWRSPISSDLIVADSIGLADAWFDGEEVYWLEGRPKEQGRCVVVQHRAEALAVDRTPPPFNARTRVHEYGGGAVLIAEGTIYFSHFADHHLYRQRAGEAPVAIAKTELCRYADAVADPGRQRLICVREDHRTSDLQPVNTLVAIAMDGSYEVDLAPLEGRDFYSNPRLSPDGRWLAWLTWNHPHMPWVSTELWVAELNGAGEIVARWRVAGSETESLLQPEWSPGGELHFISDRSGWWNLYRGDDETKIVPVYPKAAEFGRPAWVFGMSGYAFLGDGRIVCASQEAGVSKLEILGESGPLTVPTTYTEITNLRAHGQQILFRGGSPTQPAAIVRLSLEPFAEELLRRSSNAAESEEVRACLSVPQHREFSTRRGPAFAWYYPPCNPLFEPEPGELPPLLVNSHGGPTAQASSTLALGTQFWTSRGFAVLDVDYGGSSGYGRAYRERLHLQWGIVDQEDCTSAAAQVAAEGLADPERMAIAGGSAGGYTTLCALVFGDTFKAGASYFGVGNLEALATDTHKFESHYLDWLIGPYPEAIETYRRRSPIHSAEQLKVPVILLQGEDDKIVPPNQAEEFARVVRSKGLPLGYLLFEGEGHGFRKAANIQRALEAELNFYATVLVRSGLRY
jgi:dipeptidyl aminopeptidase/acylaminoacyl peptidase